MFPLLLLAIGAAGFAWLGPKAPKDQKVDLVLGARAPDVEQLTVRWSSPSDPEVARETTLRFARGSAPRVVHTEPRLADGEWRAEVELAGGGTFASVTRRVSLSEEATTSVDVSRALAEAP